MELRPTPFDLRFRLLRVPVTIHPLFWLGAVVLGVGLVPLNYMLIWVACVFVGILVHEMGHALAARFFGTADARIWLLLFGGLATGGGLLWPRWQRIAFSLAGPAAGFLMLGGQILLMRFAPELFEHRWAAAAYRYLYWINLYWGLLNLLPIYPLDGGHVSRELFTAVSRNGVRQSLWLSVILATVLAVLAIPDLADALDRRWGTLVWLLPAGAWAVLLFGLLAFQNVLLLRSKPKQDRYLDDRLPWER